VTDGWIPYGRQLVDDDDIAAVTTSLRSGWLTTGPAVDTFEAELSSVAGAPAVAVSSGTAALHAAYAAAGVGPETELVTTPMTFVATAAVASALGARVRFVDVDDRTLNLDPEAVGAACSSATRVVAPVDYAGHPADLEPLKAQAHAVGALLVEDASHSLGAEYRGRPIGAVADMTTFSFHPVKLITTGEGGAVATGNAELERTVRRFRTHGLVRDPDSHRMQGEGAWHQEVHELGLNYRLADPLAALGTSQLRKLSRFIDRRTELARRYHSNLASVEGIRLPITLEDVRHAWHLYPIRVLEGRRRHVFDFLRSKGIGVQVHYLPVHLHPVFSDMGYEKGSCPVAEQAYDELISLPLFPDLTDDLQDRVMEELRAGLRV